MSQHDFIIANQTASNARSDINNALQSLATNNSGSSAPSTTYSNMWWYDTGANILKIRNESDTAWINVAYVNQSTDKFEILDDTKVVTTSGTQVGILGDQTEVVWETGTSTTESLVSPAKVKAAISELSVKRYDSGYFSFSDNGIYNLTHGLGDEPDLVTVKAKCKVADQGYSVGDVVIVTTSMNDIGGANEGHGFTVTSTILRMSTGNNGVGHVINKNGGGTLAEIVPERWDVRVQAFRFPS